MEVINRAGYNQIVNRSIKESLAQIFPKESNKTAESNAAGFCYKTNTKNALR